jgi:Flp pilus assembly protein TadD
MAVLRVHRGELREAEVDLLAAVRIEPAFAPARANLADLYRQQGREDEARSTLRDGLKRQPGDAGLHHALGLALIRAGQRVEALTELARAAALRPDAPRYAYVHAVALHDAGRAREAMAVLERAHERASGDADILEALVAYAREAGDEEEADRWASELARARWRETRWP